MRIDPTLTVGHVGIVPRQCSTSQWRKHPADRWFVRDPSLPVNYWVVFSFPKAILPLIKMFLVYI